MTRTRVQQTVMLRNSLLRPATTIRVTGYKHSAVAILAASLSYSQAEITLTNIPHIQDILILKSIFNSLGAKVELNQGRMTINTKNLCNFDVPESLSKQIHGAIYLIPMLLGRLGEVVIGACGGCQIGEQTELGKRPIEHMLDVLKTFSAEFKFVAGKLIGRTKGLKACKIDIMKYSDEKNMLTGPLVSGATKTALLAAIMAVDTGVTKILNPYPKCDVVELVNFIKKIGYIVHWQDNCITLTKRKFLQTPIHYHIMPDITQVITWISCAVYHRVAIKLVNLEVEKVKIALKDELISLAAMGIDLIWLDRALMIPKIQGKTIHQNFTITSTGIYSDHQPFFALMLLEAGKPSTIKEMVWKNRFDYAREMKKLGLDLRIENHHLMIHPSQSKESKQVLYATDLRAAAVLILAALRAPLYTYIVGCEHLIRGYDDFFSDLKKLDVNVSFIDEPVAE